MNNAASYRTSLRLSAMLLLVGHPDYYPQFGFKNVSSLVHEGVPQEVFFALSFDGHYPQGAVAFHEAFRADGRPEAVAHTGS